MSQDNYVNKKDMPELICNMKPDVYKSGEYTVRIPFSCFPKKEEGLFFEYRFIGLKYKGE